MAGDALDLSVGDCQADRRPKGLALYTAEERRRRDESAWTLVQGVLAPLQFLVFIASLALVLKFLATGEGQAAADLSIVIKTLVLYTIMITGSIWEKVVFGKWLFAQPFFWEDVFSMLVLALHTAYLVALFTDALGPVPLMYLGKAGFCRTSCSAAPNTSCQAGSAGLWGVSMPIGGSHTSSLPCFAIVCRASFLAASILASAPS